MTITITPTLDPRGTCSACPASKDGCAARKLFSGSRCCSRCSHGPLDAPPGRPADRASSMTADRQPVVRAGDTPRRRPPPAPAAGPVPRDVDRQRLVAFCERHNIPVSVVVNGIPYLLRTAAQLADLDDRHIIRSAPAAPTERGPT